MTVKNLFQKKAKTSLTRMQKLTGSTTPIFGFLNISTLIKHSVLSSVTFTEKVVWLDNATVVRWFDKFTVISSV